MRYIKFLELLFIECRWSEMNSIMAIFEERKFHVIRKKNNKKT